MVSQEQKTEPFNRLNDVKPLTDMPERFDRLQYYSHLLVSSGRVITRGMFETVKAFVPPNVASKLEKRDEVMDNVIETTEERIVNFILKREIGTEELRERLTPTI